MRNGSAQSARSPSSDLLLAFAPLDKAAFGAALGVAAALTIAAVTAVTLLQPPDQGLPLGLLNTYFRGYSV